MAPCATTTPAGAVISPMTTFGANRINVVSD